MKAKTWILWFFLLATLGACKKNDQGESSTWILQVKTPLGDTFVVANADFDFNTTTFTAHITTSRIGGGAIIKKFDITGQMKSDSLIITDFVLNLTDPVETVTVNGRIRKQDQIMTGSGKYSIVQPPDTSVYRDGFVLNAQKK